ncbi:MAG TPA: tRNA pseudouridine(38-40) synthase TruA, partial [Rhizobiaceae bacterium]|nr:tRNA pseudouridine(38-40) synthase TruA [Rhizobiaceae bacterium]
FAQEPATVFAAGRTDAGVHALGQVVHLDLKRNWTAEKVAESVNGTMKFAGHPIAVLDADTVPDDFDARFSARSRRYRYRIINRRANLTVDIDRAWHVKKPLEVAAMHAAAQHLVGHHDFTTFRSQHCQGKSPMKTLDVLNVERIDHQEIVITAVSRSFLHNQVRSMVGTLKLVGEGKWAPQDVAAALAARDRKACGPVAPACGLYLEQVSY